MVFRDRLLATLRAAVPVLEEPGVLVVGSELPNLFEEGAASTLVVSQDLDIAIPVDRHAAAKARLAEIRDFRPSPEEPSVWLPERADLLELNFLGMDPARGPGDAYVLDDADLPLMVFGALSLLSPGPVLDVEGIAVPVPRLGGALMEKLVTERTGVKGDRDLLVALGLLQHASDTDVRELEEAYATLAEQDRYAVRANLSLLSLMDTMPGMPDPKPLRGRVLELLRRLEAAAPGGAP